MKKNNLEITNTKDYNTFLKQIKEQIRTSQIRAIGAVKSEMIVLYFNVGKALRKSKMSKVGVLWLSKNLALTYKMNYQKLKVFQSEI